MKKINWRYALGEILIVIIGITIAFNMNKYAETKKDLAAKKQYLQNLKIDLEADKNKLEENTVLLKEKLEDIQVILPVLNSDQNKMKIQGLLFKTADIIEFHPKNVTYHTLINSGDMRLIGDFELKKAIEEHYSSTYKHLLNDYERQENINREYLADYYIEHLNYDKLSKREFGFENEKLLKNILQSTFGSVQIKMTSSQQAIESCQELITQIENNMD